MISKAQIKRIASLQQKKYRGINNQFVVEGQKMVFEALNSDFKVVELFGLPGVLKSFSFSQKVEITVTDLNKISGFKTPPGVLAVVEIPNEKAKTFKLNTNKLQIGLELTKFFVLKIPSMFTIQKLFKLQWDQFLG